MTGSSLGPELLLLGGAACVVAVGLVLMAVAAALVGFAVRRRRPSPAAREDVLTSLGYRSTGEGCWSMPLYGTALHFEEGSDGWRWKVRLPRYNTLTLQVEERSSGVVPEGRLQSPESPVLGERFVIGAERSVQSQALIASRGFGEAMLGMPFLSLRLEGDELTLADPALRGLAKLAGGSVVVGTGATLAAERQVHLSVAALVTALFDTLYSKQTGTLLPEHR